MDINELLNIIKKGEDSKTQFKSKVDSINALAAEMCAFANSEGGYLIIGVDDNGSITGVQDVKSLNQWIANAANQKIEPPIDVTTENVLYEDKVVVVIKVPAGYNKPYAANKTEFWVKVGSDNRRATREELQRLMQASGDIYADEMPIAGTSIEDIDFYYFKNFYEKEYGINLDELLIPLENLLTNLKLMINGNLTLSGLLLFGKKPERIRPQYIVRAVSFFGNELGDSNYLDSLVVPYMSSIKGQWVL